jgi:uncharacterized lipoprotein YddW (UPF0748 family)
MQWAAKPVRARGLVALTLLLALGLATPAAGPAPAPAGAPLTELRALWVLRTSLTDPVRIDRLVRHAAESGFNALFVQVRARGDAFYAGGPEPRGAGIRPGFDPLRHTIDAARAARLRVHVWLNLNLVASAVTLPTDPAHIVRAHPEWLMVPRELAPALVRLSPSDPRYLSRLAAWTAARLARHEGLFASPITPEAARYLEGIAADLTTRYPVDGVHLDYVRYPSTSFDYSAAALAAFRASLLPALAPADRARLDARLARDPLVYADTFPQRWITFRQLRVTDLVARIRGAVQRARPGVTLSAAVFPDPDDAAANKLQDWRNWAERGLVDAFCPMAYTTSLPHFSRQIGVASRAVAPQALWAGIGAYRLTPAQTVTHIAAARQQGARGVVLFSYDSLVEAPGRSRLFDIGRSAFVPARAAAGRD